jgi:hypothetical protein
MNNQAPTSGGGKGGGTEGTGGTGTEQRRHARHGVFLDTSVSIPFVGTIQCKIRDYCQEGMFITWDAEQARRLDIAFTAGIELSLEFHVPHPEGFPARHFDLEARVTRLLPAGAGLIFHKDYPAALAALAAHAETNAQEAAATVAAALRARLRAEAEAALDEVLYRDLYRELKAEIKEMARRHFLLMVRDLFLHINRHLPARIEATPASSTRVALVELHEYLTEQRPTLEPVLVVALTSLWDEPETQIPGGWTRPTAEDLSMVNQEEFEDLMAAGAFVARIESLCHNALADLNARLGVCLLQPIDNGNNPLGPMPIIGVFTQLMRNLGLPIPLRRVLYEYVDNAVGRRIARLYDDLIVLCKVHHVEPDTDPYAAAAPSGISLRETLSPSPQPSPFKGEGAKTAAAPAAPAAGASATPATRAAATPATRAAAAPAAPLDPLPPGGGGPGRGGSDIPTATSASAAPTAPTPPAGPIDEELSFDEWPGLPK